MEFFDIDWEALNEHIKKQLPETRFLKISWVTTQHEKQKPDISKSITAPSDYHKFMKYFDLPFKDLPLYLHSENKELRTVVHYRLEKGE